MTLRPMTMDDSDFMLELKNYTETRKFAIVTQDIITWSSHYHWLEKHVQEFQVIEEVGGRRIGAVRIQRIPQEDKTEEGKYVKLQPDKTEISIWIDRQFWGLGYATEVIKKLRKDNMTAKIVDGNVASIRAFIKAGFLPAHFIDNKYYIFVYKSEKYAS